MLTSAWPSSVPPNQAARSWPEVVSSSVDAWTDGYGPSVVDEPGAHHGRPSSLGGDGRGRGEQGDESQNEGQAQGSQPDAHADHPFEKSDGGLYREE